LYLLSAEKDTMSKDASILPLWGRYEQLVVKYDSELGALWYFLQPHDRPCFNLDLLGELLSFQHRVREVNSAAERKGLPLPVRFTIIGSGIPGVFNLGGDLHLFNTLIQAQDKEGLFGYAKACIDVLYPNAVNFDMPLTTLSLVQGDALGGGFEAAISSNVVIAEESAKFGLPEVLFNLVPGMGAYSFLIRRTTPAVAEGLITSGEVLTAR
jgi:DSF synthase